MKSCLSVHCSFCEARLNETSYLLAAASHRMPAALFLQTKRKEILSNREEMKGCTFFWLLKLVLKTLVVFIEFCTFWQMFNFY